MSTPTPAQLPRKRKVERPQPPPGVRNPAMFDALRRAQLAKNQPLASGR